MCCPWHRANPHLPTLNGLNKVGLCCSPHLRPKRKECCSGDDFRAWCGSLFPHSDSLTLAKNGCRKDPGLVEESLTRCPEGMTARPEPRLLHRHCFLIYVPRGQRLCSGVKLSTRSLGSRWFLNFLPLELQLNINFTTSATSD